MARTLAFAYKRGEVIQTSPANISFDEEQNGRAFLYSASDISDLLEDLRGGKGIHTPLWCRPFTLEAGGQGLFLVAGQRRLLAGLEYLKENPEYLIKVLMVEPKDDQETLEMNVLENAGHNGLTIVDQGHVALRLRSEPTKTGGRTLDEIAKLLHVSQAQVSQAIKLVEGLPESVQRLIKAGKISSSDALDVLKVSDPDKRKALIEEFFADRIKTKPLVISEPIQPVGQVERPIPVEAEAAPVPEESAPGRNIRDSVREAGGKVSLRMPELKKYLQLAIDEDGPGSNKGEVQLKKKLLEFIEGKFSQRTMDGHFNNNCKMKGN